MSDVLTGEALRLHLFHCAGCPECAHVAPDGLPYGAPRDTISPVPAIPSAGPECPHLANNRDDCWECFTDEHPDMVAAERMNRHFGADAFGPGEDYEGREAPHDAT